MMRNRFLMKWMVKPSAQVAMKDFLRIASGLAFLSSFHLTFSLGLSAEKIELTRFFPAGGPLGTKIQVEAVGKFPIWPLKLWSDTDSIHWNCLSEAGKLEATIGNDAQPGLHWVRLYDEQGATAVRPFLVGKTLERIESEPNDLQAEANEIPSLPHAVHGVLQKKGDVDLYSIALKASQLLVATIDAVKGLQSPVDTNVQILDSSGFVVAENMDHVGLDPYLEFIAPKDGLFVVRVFGFPAVPDSKIGFGGGNDWCYRLRLESDSRPFGSLLAVPPTSDLDVNFATIVPGHHVSMEQAAVVAIPASFGSSISESNQTDYVRFQAKANVHYRFRVYAREFGSTLDPTIAILDSKGKQLIQADDSGNLRDPVLLWKAPKDSNYYLTISDFHRSGGVHHAYRAIIEERPPSFSLSIANEWIQTKIGKESEIKVKVERESEFAEPISISIEGLPESLNCSKETSINGSDTAKLVTLRLKGTTAFQGPVQITARCEGTDHPVRVAIAENAKPIWLSVDAE
jgi:hypothetical protein